MTLLTGQEFGMIVVDTTDGRHNLVLARGDRVTAENKPRRRVTYLAARRVQPRV